MHYDPIAIPLQVLIAIHLHTHSATKKHSLREKYRSAVYVFEEKIEEIQMLIADNQIDFDEQLITKAILFYDFKSNVEKQQHYYTKNKEGFFCERYISPKLKMIEKEYSSYFKQI